MSNHVKAILEKVEPEFGSSFVMRTFSDSSNQLRPLWHYHPELELIYIEEGSGKRHVGNHLSYFSEGELLLIGSNLPHYGFESKLNDENKEIVIQISNIFEMAQLGISYHGKTKIVIGEHLKKMQTMAPFEKLLGLIRVFHILSTSQEYTILNATGPSLQVKGDDNLRIDKIYEYVRNNFASKISVDQVAKEVNMTVPAFCRFFKKTTNKTFVQFLTEFRVAHSCKLLSYQSQSVMEVAFECGFLNLSNFNRAFKKITGKSPSAFRQQKVRVVI